MEEHILKNICIEWTRINVFDNEAVSTFIHDGKEKICNEKTYKKIQKGEQINEFIYDNFFLKKNMFFKIEHRMNILYLEKIKKINKLYEFGRLETLEKELKVHRNSSSNHVYPYLLFDSLFLITYNIIIKRGSVIEKEKFLLYKLLQLNNQDIKTLCSLLIFTTKTRGIEFLKSIKEMYYSLPLIDNYIGLDIKTEILLLTMDPCFMERNKQFYKYVRMTNNKIGMIEYNIKLEGYYSNLGEDETANKILNKINRLFENNLWNDRIYAQGMQYYLATSYFYIGDYKQAKKNILPLLNKEDARLYNCVFMYYAICIIFKEDPVYFPIEKVNWYNLDALTKVEMTYFELYFNRANVSKLKKYILNQYLPVLSKENVFDLLFLEKEIKRMDILDELPLDLKTLFIR